MLRSSLSLVLCAAALAVAGCNEAETNNTATAPPEGAEQAAGEQTIAASINENSRFFQAARAVGLDATLDGPGPYTVLVPSDEAFAGMEGALANPTDPGNRAEITRLLTFHILPGVILGEDIDTAIQNGDGSAVLATMGGETLTATREGDTIVLTGAGDSSARIVQAGQQASNGVIHRIDGVLIPPGPETASAGGEQSAPATDQQ